MALTRKEYEEGKTDPDLVDLDSMPEITKKSRTAPTRICISCGFTNGCTANHCENTGCVQFTGWQRRLGWTKGDPNATIAR